MRIVKPPESAFYATSERDPSMLPEFQELIRHANEEYLYWDAFRYQPMPEGVAPEEAWAYLRHTRIFWRRYLPFADKEGREFVYSLQDSFQQTLHEIDMRCGGVLDEDQGPPADQAEPYIVSSLMEEAIASSQLEGAATTRKVAKEMLQTGRKPRDRGEQMIFNNWATMQHLRQIKDKPLSREMLLEIQALITNKTLKDENDAGRVRTTNDVVVEYDDEIIHEPPDWQSLEERMARLVEFANNDEPWIHPVVKASILHFMLGYDHYFADGNGRTARAIFYWYLLSRKYEIFQYLSISRHFKAAPVKYMKAYLDSELDGGDLTYFIVYSMRVVQSALDDLQKYLQRKKQEEKRADSLLLGYRDLNYRQRDLLLHAMKHTDARYTIAGHQKLQSIARGTARRDLLELAERGLFEVRKVGRTFIFYPSATFKNELRGS